MCVRTGTTVYYAYVPVLCTSYIVHRTSYIVVCSTVCAIHPHAQYMIIRDVTHPYSRILHSSSTFLYHSLCHSLCSLSFSPFSRDARPLAAYVPIAGMHVCSCTTTLPLVSASPRVSARSRLGALSAASLSCSLAALSSSLGGS